MRKLPAISGLVLAALLAWGTEPGKRPAPAKPAARVSEESDTEIEKNIRARFAKSKINEDKFQVHVQGGVATLEGKTDVIQHKGVATRLAKSGGAVAVANHIQISDAAREKAAKNLETGRRRAQIKRGEPHTRGSR
jgi:hypothetical protein